MFERSLEFFFGNAESRTLQQRTTTMVALFVVLVAVTASLHNILGGLPLVHHAFSCSAFILGLVFYFISKKVVESDFLGKVMVVVFTILLFASWFPTNGSYGPTPFFLIMLYVFSIIVLNKKWRLFYSLVYVGLVVSVAMYELKNPGYLNDYNTVADRYYDVIIALLFSVLIMGLLVYFVVEAYQVERRKSQEAFELIKRTNLELEQAFNEIKTLKSILPICSHCKKIRDEHGEWEDMSEYIAKQTDTKFTHGICPECCEIFYPQLGRKSKT